MPSAEPEVSVVCSTYNRSERLPAMLTALERQTLGCDRFEVVIVDNGSTDNTRETLDTFAARSSLRLRVVHLAQNRGPAGGRNEGWRAAGAPIVAFTDDDCAPDEAWLQRGVDAFASGARIVVGRTEPNPEQTHNAGAFSRTQRIGEQSAKRYFQTCNIFYRRDDLVSANGFDEGFSHKGGEDTDLGWRLLDRGAEVAFEADALVFHDITRGSFRAAVREAGSWGDIPRVTKLHKVRAKPILVHRFFWKKTHELVILAVGGVTIAVVVRNPIPLLAVIPWARFRLRKWPIVPGSAWKRASYLPHALVIDVVEVTATVRGAIRNRVLVL